MPHPERSRKCTSFGGKKEAELLPIALKHIFSDIAYTKHPLKTMADSKDRGFLFRVPKESSSLKRGANHLFVVGIDAYYRLQKLDNAVRDAKAFRDVLLERYRFKENHVYELYDAQATRRTIMGELRNLVSRLKPEDSLIMYFSGHGHYDEVLEEGYWVPVGATYEVVDEYIPYTFLQKIVRALEARHVLMVVDSCYSGAMLVRERDLVMERLEKDPSRWLLASGRNEVVPDGSPLDKNHSPFAKELLDLLRNYSEDGLTTQMLIARMTENVSYNSKQTPIGQALQDVGHQGGQFVFYPQKNEKRDWAIARESNTVAAYLQFIENYPKGQHTDEAHWQVASLENTKDAYRDYIDKGGAHFGEAVKLLGRLEEKDDFERAKRKGESALRGFLMDYPGSNFKEQALAEIDRIREIERDPELERQQKDSEEAERREKARKKEEAKALAAKKREENLEKFEEELKLIRPKEIEVEPVPIFKRPAVRYALIGLPIILLLLWGIPQLTKQSKTDKQETYKQLLDKADTLFKQGRKSRKLTVVEDGLFYYKEAGKVKITAATQAGERACLTWIQAYNDSLRDLRARLSVPKEDPRQINSPAKISDAQQLLKEKGYRIISGWYKEVAIYEKGSGRQKIMGLVNKDAKLIGAVYYKVEGLANGYAIFHKGGKRGYINLQGKEVINARFEAASEFDRSGIAKVMEKGKTFFINVKGVCVKGCG
jgi:hypothetical protein